MKLIVRPLYLFAGVLSEQLWGRVPGPVHRRVSESCSKFLNTAISRHLIVPYCLINYGNINYHRYYRPGSGSERYHSFQDFFTRDFLQEPELSAETVWPCEGYLCDKGKVSELREVKVKGHRRHIRAIFAEKGAEISEDGYFTNVFLHNKNYHHIHAPVSGTVRWVKRIPGDLLLLRPWAYRKKPSLPAITNERVNVAIVDSEGRDWFLSIVGGPMVASIRILGALKEGMAINAGQKLATFELGSTCCMVSPILPTAEIGETVHVAHPLDGKEKTDFAEQMKISALANEGLLNEC